MNQRLISRMRVGLLIIGSLCVLSMGIAATAFIQMRRERAKLTKELTALKAEMVRYGQPVEIHNSNWGTVLDAVDPAIFPSSDPRDPRMGARIQQYVPRANKAQTWELRPAQGAMAATEPLPARAYMNHALMFQRNRDFPKAIQAFENCIQLYPENSDAYQGLAMALRESGNFSRAISVHDQAIERDSKRHEFYWERGITYLRMRELDKAINDFQAALERNSGFGNAELGLAMAYREKGSLAEALAHHDKAIGIDPQQSWFYRERATTYERKGEAQLAQADLAKARELDATKRPEK